MEKLDYRSPPAVERAPAPKQMPRVEVPEYDGLRIGSVVLSGLSVIYLILAIIVGGIGILNAIAASSGTPPLWGIASMACFGYALLVGMASGLFYALSAACLALRDIARNSFR